VLRDVSLSVADGEMVALLGSNGAGKTTLMRTITGLVRPTAGAIRVGGADITRQSPDRVSRSGVALVPEGRRVFSMLTVRENLLLAGHGHGKYTAEDLDFVCEVFPALKDKLRAHGDQLSGGQQQMVALGRAVMQRPRLILLDEPSIGLSPLIVQQLPRMIAGVQERTGAAVLLVEQDAGMALSLVDRAYLLRSGRIISEGAAAELRSSGLLIETYLGQHGDTAPAAPERS
jgi:branched-chain amino acid transport system ATP-binding protein